MILLTSMLHREELKDIIFRWMRDDLREEDCKKIKKIINFNVYIVNLYMDTFCRDLFSYLSGGEVWSFEVKNKGELKDFILKAAPYRDERLDYLAERYHKYPEDFFRSSPFHGKIYCIADRNQPAYLGHSRIKRFRRVAEKASRRMISIIFNQIKKRADALALERASRLGVPKEHLWTPIEEQVEEFAHAERRFIKELRRGQFFPDEEIIRSSRIHDVAGIKAIIDDSKEAFFEDYFLKRDEARIIEKERHAGNFNAVNYLVEYRIDKEALIGSSPDERVLKVLAARGLDTESICVDYEQFIRESENEVFIEIITSNYREMIESELGRCMHEERILSQREQIEYRSSIARNVRYLTEYLFLFAISGKNSVKELPIRLWEKTMPDTYDHSIRALWDIPTIPVL